MGPIYTTNMGIMDVDALRVLCDVNVVQEYIGMFPKKVPVSS
jgi:hypothetical protein